MYDDIGLIIKRIRELAKTDDKKHGEEFYKDIRYLKILDDLSLARKRCTDSTLNEMFDPLLGLEVWCAEWGFTATEASYDMTKIIERNLQNIRTYIDKKYKKR